MKKIRTEKIFSPARVISLGFLLLIFTGTILLMLPFSSTERGGASFIDALFTSTSAVCVTGLVVHDTATYWSGFGQGVILFLIQIGGMGVVTMAVATVMLSGKKINLMQRSTMAEAISAHHVGGIVRLTGFILKTTVFIEIIGALIMSPAFIKEFGIGKGVWYSFFHSISAFCNAGFDLMGVKSPYSSLTSFEENPLINITIMLLIVIGGIGFLTWEDISVNKFKISKYRMQSKVILLVSALLIILPALYFYFIEFSYAKWDSMSTAGRIFGSVFQSVTTRTAGFNTIDLTSISEISRFIMIILMLIGGSPGSTAGGMKTTTIAVLFSNIISVFRRREHSNLFGRRVPNETMRYAATILMTYVALFFAGGIIIAGLDDIPIVTGLFEAASAVGTVGLTLGVTSTLSLVSRLVLIGLMFFGRVGALTLVFAAISGPKSHYLKYPQEKIIVG